MKMIESLVMRIEEASEEFVLRNNSSFGSVVVKVKKQKFCGDVVERWSCFGIGSPAILDKF